jgi:hypothetical protein
MGALGGRMMIADALDARHRLPDTWERVVARQARVPWVRHLARKTRHLSVEAARKVDADLADAVDGSVPWSRFCLRLDARIIAADPELAARREEEKRREAFAKATRSSEDGMKGFYLRGPVAVVLRFDATVTYVAQALKALGDTDTEDERRVKACLLLANPMQAVELLAAYAAHRARTGATDDVPLLPEDEAHASSDPEDEDQEDERGAEDAAEPHGPGTSSDADTNDDDPEEAEPQDDEPQDDEPAVPRVFRPAELPAWVARASDPATTLGTVLMDWPKLLPRVNVFLHLAEETIRAARDGTPDGVVRWEGEGPVTLQYVREHLAP